jgi:hypothetical protein
MTRTVPWVLVAAALSACQCGPGPGADGGVDAGLSDAGEALDAGFTTTCAASWPTPVCGARDVLGRLGCVPNLTATRGASAPAGYTQFDLVFHQQVDAQNADAGTFDQRAVLLFVDEMQPMVVMTSGYDLGPYVYAGELARTFGANVLLYEHRFFGPSRPSSNDWSQLTIRQAADDAHAMVSALRWMFPARWMNTGGSKGGMTSLYHRRFHPCDVDATLAYVAPVSYSPEDPAYGVFLQTVGGAQWAACRAAITAVQRRLLTERADVLPFVSGDFNFIPEQQALELAVVELPFAFWQYSSPADGTGGCGTVPGPTASAAQLVNFLDAHIPPVDLAGDASLQQYAAYYFQAQRQLGAPAPYEAPVADLLKWPHADVASTYLPPGVPVPTFEPDAMPDVNGWLDANGERVMLIYGEFDPWSSNLVPLGHAVDSYTYIAPGGNHGAGLGKLSVGDQARALATLSRWLQHPVVRNPPLRGEPEEPLRRVPR